MKKLFSMLGWAWLVFVLQAGALAQSITNQPQSITVNSESTAAFSVGASGATTYQWQFDGTNLTDGANISGATNSALTLEDVGANQAGTYTVIIDNTVTSSNAVLTVTNGTIITLSFSGLLTNAPGTNVQIALFDHDKPATVQNFLHYISNGAYSNMFFDNCIPGSLLQGGDFGASNQTATSSPVTGWSIYKQFTLSTNESPLFPAQVANEFGVGPLIHNRAGTIAMSLHSAVSTPAASAFFFNLADNSAVFDSQSNTVFGRILDQTNASNGGTNALNYFNTLSNKFGLEINQRITNNVTSATLTNLPVNYTGTNPAANANLVFGNFQSPTNAPLDTNPPVVAITSPAAPELLTNGLQGTAGDDVGLAVVVCELNPHASNSMYPYPYKSTNTVTNYAVGTTNWALSLNPGSYNVSVQSQDGAGNLSAASNETVTVTAILTNGDGAVTFTQGVTTNLNAVGYPFQIGSNYVLQAKAGTNQLFVDWTTGDRTILSPAISFSMMSNAVLTATFMSNGLPNSVAFTYPESNAVLSTNSFDISGSISNVTAFPTTVTCQLYSSNSFLPVGSPLTNTVETGETNWSVSETNVPNDAYQVQITAVDADGNSTVIYEYFSVAVISAEPQSVTVNNASTATFSITDSNAMSYQWQFNGTNLSGATNSTLTIENVNSNEEGSYTVVIDNVVTNPMPAVLAVVPGTIVDFNLSGLLPEAPGTNLVVQLFDHDKPATVENFLHYIRSGAYTNMFIDRYATGFVLQGGDYGTMDRTNTNAPIMGWDIGSYVASNAPLFTNPPFPAQLNNEYGVGPQINNDFGTLAMALGNSTNSGSSAFFFNLANNSESLDGQNFTVFGRLLNGTNVLQYFNTLSNGYGAVNAATDFSDYGALIKIPALNSLLPVNYSETNAPANTDLVFCDFTFETSFPPDTNAPTVAISSPAPGTVTTNGTPFIEGTATDDVGLADVTIVLTPEMAADGTYPNGQVAITNYAIGTSNWSVTFNNAGDSSLGLAPPGNYELSAQSQDGAGNLSPLAAQRFTITAIETNGNGSVTLTNGTNSNLNAVGYPFLNGSTYILTSIPGTNQEFLNWTEGVFTVITPNVPFPMYDGAVVTATFISNGIPNGIAFTYPPSNGIVDIGPLNITGTISGVASPPVTVVCQIYSETGATNVGPALTNIGTANWSVTASNLPADSYVVQAIATDAASNMTAISEDFSVSTNAALELNVVGPGTVSGETNGEPILVGTTFTVTATPNSGQLFYIWSNVNEVSIDPTLTNTMVAGQALTAIFVSNTLANSIGFTAPIGNVVLSNLDVQVSGTISNVPSPPVTLTCQIFSQTNLLAVSGAQTTTGTTNWSLLMSVPSAGSYIAVVEAVDQASNSTVVRQSFNAYVDGTLPAVAILSPSANAVVGDSRSLMVSGTASDTNGLASVEEFLVPQPAADGSYPNYGDYLGPYIATGTTNWSVNSGLVPPGAYAIYALALDNAGNTNIISELITNTAILVKGNGTVALTQGTNAKANPIGYPLLYRTAYTLTATPGVGQMFIGWSLGAYYTTNPTVTFTNAEGDLWTATFAPTNAGKGIAFTYPPANATLKATSFTLKGKMTSEYKSAHVTCLVSSLTTGFTVGPFLAASGAASWSAGVSNLPPDNYIVEATATNALGQTSSIHEEFAVEAFTEAAGTYTGLFICTNRPVAPTNSGFFTFTVQASGLFSGTLKFPAYAPVPIFTQGFENVDFSSGYYATVADTVPQKPLTITINLDLTGGTNVAIGNVSSSTNWSSELVCYRAAAKLGTNTIPATGKYVLGLQAVDQTNAAPANGYAALTVAANGSVALSGALADNTAISQSAKASTNGIWPVYAAPSGDGRNGMLIGWVTNDASGNCSGQLYWQKAAGIGGYFSGGIGVSNNMLLTATGTNYTRPATGGQYSIVFEGGTILSPLTNTLTVTNAGRFKVTGGAADDLKITLSANGVIGGSIVNTNDKKTLSFKGAFISPSQGGAGFIPDVGGQVGSFELRPAP